MRGLVKASLILLCAAILIAALGVLPFLSLPLRSGRVWEPVEEKVAYDGTIAVVVRGDVEHPGTYHVPYDATYAEIFALAGAQAPVGISASDPIDFADAVLIGDEFYIWLVL